MAAGRQGVPPGSVPSSVYSGLPGAWPLCQRPSDLFAGTGDEQPPLTSKPSHGAPIVGFSEPFWSGLFPFRKETIADNINVYIGIFYPPSPKQKHRALTRVCARVCVWTCVCTASETRLRARGCRAPAEPVGWVSPPEDKDPSWSWGTLALWALQSSEQGPQTQIPGRKDFPSES